MAILDDKGGEGKMKCPYCKKVVAWEQAIFQGAYKFCPHCNKRIVYTMTIYPSKKRSWEKPLNV
jgi:endogenous inhibitor of DNA gyrase (YacG/DUF329 family)